ncbi:MAG TPA: cyanophycin synthetase [Polyangiaceae bacterium]|nr:cyanophycin synthetase [Polyangiaceae bacterium]
MTPSKDVVLERLYRLAPRGALLGLERVLAACAALGHPELRFPSVHVAGTNGKGSVSAMIAAMATAAGKRVGLYTSPHLACFNERIQVSGRPLDDAVLVPLLDDVLVRCPDLTFFETATIAAFLAFANASVDVAILEVGLGGRLDATNVIAAPIVTAITSIALDHIDRLGAGLAAIAGEKAGILKRGVPVVVGPLREPALGVVVARARATSSPLLLTESDADLGAFVARHPPALAGAHQVDNAKVAVALGRELGLGEAFLAAGLRQVRWPGRLETLSTPNGLVLLDTAHNHAGALALAAELEAMKIDPETTALVFGSMADKDYEAMLAALASLARHRTYVTPEGRRAADPSALAAIAPGRIATTALLAIEGARRAVGPEGLVVVTGSIFLVGEVRARLLGLDRDPAVAL